MSLSVTVKNVFGKKWVVEVQDGHSTVGELRHALLNQHQVPLHGDIYFKGTTLDHSTPLWTLNILPQQYLTLVSRAKAVGRTSGITAGKAAAPKQVPASDTTQAQRQPVMPQHVEQASGGFLTTACAPSSDLGAFGSAAVATMLRQHNGELDTLLPGYSSRPMRSPLKPMVSRLAPSGQAAATATMRFAHAAGLSHPGAWQPDAPVPLALSTTALPQSRLLPQLSTQSSSRTFPPAAIAEAATSAILPVSSSHAAPIPAPHRGVAKSAAEALWEELANEVLCTSAATNTTESRPLLATSELRPDALSGAAAAPRDTPPHGWTPLPNNAVLVHCSPGCSIAAQGSSGAAAPLLTGALPAGQLHHAAASLAFLPAPAACPEGSRGGLLVASPDHQAAAPAVAPAVNTCAPAAAAAPTAAAAVLDALLEQQQADDAAPLGVTGTTQEGCAGGREGFRVSSTEAVQPAGAEHSSGLAVCRAGPGIRHANSAPRHAPSLIFAPPTKPAQPPAVAASRGTQAGPWHPEGTAPALPSGSPQKLPCRGSAGCVADADIFAPAAPPRRRSGAASQGCAAELHTAAAATSCHHHSRHASPNQDDGSIVAEPSASASEGGDMASPWPLKRRRVPSPAVPQPGHTLGGASAPPAAPTRRGRMRHVADILPAPLKRKTKLPAADAPVPAKRRVGKAALKAAQGRHDPAGAACTGEEDQGLTRAPVAHQGAAVSGGAGGPAASGAATAAGAVTDERALKRQRAAQKKVQAAQKKTAAAARKQAKEAAAARVEAASKRAAAFASLPLPPVAERLVAAFESINAFYPFAMGQRVQLSWHICGDAIMSLCSLPKEHAMTLADVEAMARLAPEVVCVRDRSQPHNDAVWEAEQLQHVAAAEQAMAAARRGEVGADGAEPSEVYMPADETSVERGSPYLTATAGGQAATAAAAAAAVVQEGMTPRMQLGTTGAGFLEGPAAAAGWSLRTVSRASVAATSLLGGAQGSGSRPDGLLEAAAGDPRSMGDVAGSRVVVEGAGAAVLAGHRDTHVIELVDPGRHWSPTSAIAAEFPDSSAEGEEPAVLPARRKSNVTQRRCNAFHHILTCLVHQRHSDFLASWGQDEAYCPNLAEIGVLPAAASSAAGATIYDPIQHGSWHPEFPLHSITLSQLQAAAAVRHARLAAAGDGSGRTLQCHSSAPRPPQLLRKHAPCTSTQALGAEEFLQHLQELTWYNGQVTHVEQLPARASQYAWPQVQLAEPVRRALEAKGVANRLFTHQAAAIDLLLLMRRHVVVCTSTASGKSLCYNVAVLQALSQDQEACSLYLFPTKALAQDQLRALRELVTLAFGGGEHTPAVEVYDGDTAQSERPIIRQRAQLLITNPDMLHASVLPVHDQFTRLLAHLKFVVVDEGHAYKGVFGCHTALVLRRLRRLCTEVYGSHFQFVMTSATVANPQAHAQELLGVPDVALVDNDGSPHGSKAFVLWNPPLLLPPAVQSVSTTLATDADATLKGTGAPSRADLDFARERHTTEGSGERCGVGQASGGGGTEAAAGKPGDAGEDPGLAAALAASTAAYMAAAVAPGAPKRKQHSTRKSKQALRDELRRNRQARAPGVQLSSEVDAQMWASLVGQAAPTRTLAHHIFHSPLVSPARRPPAGSSPPSRAAVPDGASTAAMPPPPPQPPPVREMSTAERARLLAQARAALNLVEEGNSSRPPRRLVMAPKGGRFRSDSRGGNSRSSALLPGAGRSARSADITQDVEDEINDRLPDAKAWVKGVKEGNGRRDSWEDNERRNSPIVELSLLLAECMQHGQRTIAFCGSRKNCELVTAYTRQALASAVSPLLAARLRVYRAGYSPAERRQMEAELHSGELLAVAATNALELGVDVGGLDATLHLGFPGSIASLRQQAGRAGRRERPSLALYVAFDGPLDQWFMQHPHELFSRPIEEAQVDASNPHVLLQHALCAAVEMPLSARDTAYFGAGLPAVMVELQRLSLVGHHPREPSSARLHYTGPVDNPAREFSLRSIDAEKYAIMDEDTQEVLEEIEASKAFYEVYDGAIYLYQGRAYLCKRLDQAGQVAWVRKADVKYYTRLRDYTDVHVTGGALMYHPHNVTAASQGTTAPDVVAPVEAWNIAAGKVGRAKAVADTSEAAAVAIAAAATAKSVKSGPILAAMPPCVAGTTVAGVAAGLSTLPPWTSAVCERALVTCRFLGFHRVWQGTGQVFDTVDLWLPDVRYETQAAHVRVPVSARQECAAAGLDFREGVHAAGHALLNVLPLYMMCNRGDMRTECDNPNDTRSRPARLLLYDTHPGGMGLAAQATPLFGRLLNRAHELVLKCPCSGHAKGCPACVQHTACSNYNVVLNKQAAEIVLRHVITAEAGAQRRATGLSLEDEAIELAAALAAAEAGSSEHGPKTSVRDSS